MGRRIHRFKDISSSYSLKIKSYTSFRKPFERRFIWDQAQISSSICLEIITTQSHRGQNQALQKISFSAVLEKQVYMRHGCIYFVQQNTDLTSISCKTVSNLYPNNTILVILPMIQAKKFTIFCRHFDPKSL